MKRFSYEVGFHMVGMMFAWTVGPVGVGVLVRRFRRVVGVRGRDLGWLRAAERAEDGRDLGVGWLELGFVPAGGPAIGRNAGGDKKEQS